MSVLTGVYHAPLSATTSDIRGKWDGSPRRTANCSPWRRSISPCLLRSTKACHFNKTCGRWESQSSFFTVGQVGSRICCRWFRICWLLSVPRGLALSRLFARESSGNDASLLPFDDLLLL